MTFKDQLIDDLGVFFNMDEHADMHRVNGQDLLIIMDTDDTKERPRQPIDLYNSTGGMYLAEMTVYIRVSNLDDKPVIGGHFDIDDRFYRVTACSEQAGMYKIVLEVHDA